AAREMSSVLYRGAGPGAAGEPAYAQSGASGDNRRQYREEDRPAGWDGSGAGADRVHGAAWDLRGQPGGHLCGGGVLDAVAATVRGQAGAGQSAVVAQVP